MTGHELEPAQYAEVLSRLKTEVRAAQLQAQRTVNSALLELFWTIGHEILAQQQALGWGAKVIDQLAHAGVALGGVPLDPGLDALARDPHRGRDMGLTPPLLVTLNNQPPTVNGQASTTVGHENLRVDVGLRQATPHPGVLLTSSRRARHQPHGRV